ncbi:MAG: dihydroorotase [Halobacteriovoraceae bacterium]|nr:dihydroorotase [Halobacteriovoraceae bacterium]
MDKILIKNASICGGEIKDILIEGYRIKEISNEIQVVAKTIDAKKMIALPGLIDMQVHLRVPGQENKENIETGTMAAARGGFTTVACMPNTNPCLDNEETLKLLMSQLEREANCQVIPIPAMTKNIRGEEICDYQMYKNHGIIGITDDGRGVQNDRVMDEIFKLASQYGLSIFQHCEFENISHGNPLHLGKTSKSYHIEGQPGTAESEMVRRDIELLAKYGGHYHVLHMSSKESLAYVKEAKKSGLNVTCEVSPHHLLLSDEDIPELNTNFKMNPPLRSPEDRDALQEGLINGDVDIISTDHAPHTQEEKSRDIYKAPFGIVGLETALALIYTHFVKNKKISLKNLIELMSRKPKEIFKLESGQLQVGDLADMTLMDPNKIQKVCEEKFYSLGRNTPFSGWDLVGWPIMTMNRGKITFEDKNYEL